MANSSPSCIEISEDEELQHNQDAEMPINDDQDDQNECHEDEEVEEFGEEDEEENDADYDAYLAEMLASNFNRNAAGISAQTESRGGAEEGGKKRRRIGGPETSSLGGIGSAGGSQGSEWNRSEIGGLFCPICLDAWTNDGDHRICCLPCGHVFGMSCITKWLQSRNSRKCPQCNQKYKMKDVRKLFVSQRIRVLKDKCASLEEKVADYSKKEGEWIKREVEQQLKVQQCIKVG
ncbi:hypothetical protein ACE6H2_024346 [Prunus campanulata]